MKPDDKNKSKVGQLIEGTAFRDAIHVAVAPVIAGEDLEPGDKVAFHHDGTVNTWHTNKIGVVDPFLTGTVKQGEKFWLFLFPGTAQNLRHEWDHPDFRKSESEMPADVAASRMYLSIYADSHKLTLDDLLAGVAKYIDEEKCDGAVFEDDFHEYEVPDVFWAHYNLVTGKTGHGNFWGCCI